MKLRLTETSVRFRITPPELEALNRSGRVVNALQLYNEAGTAVEGRLEYEIVVQDGTPSSRCTLEPGRVMFYLSENDLATLNDPGQEGVYVERHGQTPEDGDWHFTACVEKDRKPEAA